MLKRIKKIALWLIFLLVASALGVLIFSPFTKKGNNDYRSVEYSVEIDAPVETVFNYLGNSNHAEDWSSYIDHISSLNSAVYQDGEKGSLRRCFKNANEDGIFWDEEILEVIANKKRVLSIYNMQGFAAPINGLETEQIYEVISPDKTRLTFSLFFAGHSASWFENFKMHMASYTIYARFRDNLEKVSEIVSNK
ncbi:MAG: hypothetical protein ACI8ZM_000126 [Crocinitomix sp.]|jgi:uncharacterized protein YndB with AHSA1/START domain